MLIQHTYFLCHCRVNFKNVKNIFFICLKIYNTTNNIYVGLKCKELQIIHVVSIKQSFLYNIICLSLRSARNNSQALNGTIIPNTKSVFNIQSIIKNEDFNMRVDHCFRTLV